MLFCEKYTKPWRIALFEANEMFYHLYSYQPHTVLIKILTATSEKLLFEEGNLPHNVTVLSVAMQSMKWTTVTQYLERRQTQCMQKETLDHNLHDMQGEKREQRHPCIQGLK